VTTKRTDRDAGADEAPAEEAAPPSKAASSKAPKARPAPAPDEEPAEPTWFRDLDGADRGRARRLIAALEQQDVADAESIVRRDLAGGVPALAAQAIAMRLAELPDDAPVARVVELLAEGRDQTLGVRWRIVDGDGRQVLVEPPKRSRGSR
jgi:hypothetical protein